MTVACGTCGGPLLHINDICSACPPNGIPDPNALRPEVLPDGVETLSDPNTTMAVRLADRLIAEGFQEPDEHLAVLSKAVVMLHDELIGLVATRAKAGAA